IGVVGGREEVVAVARDEEEGAPGEGGEMRGEGLQGAPLVEEVPAGDAAQHAGELLREGWRELEGLEIDGPAQGDDGADPRIGGGVAKGDVPSGAGADQGEALAIDRGVRQRPVDGGAGVVADAGERVGAARAPAAARMEGEAAPAEVAETVGDVEVLLDARE